jgi:iron complex transport system substrate-binding protein
MTQPKLPMRDRLTKALVIILALLAPLLVPKLVAGAEPKAFFTITDALGKTVEVHSGARRIVVTNGDAAEILCALGVGDRIVGITDHIAESATDLLPELKGKPVIGSSQAPNIERIAELRPELVIAYEMWMTQEAFEAKLAPLHIPVARLLCYRVEHLQSDIRILGKIAGREKEAEEYNAYFQGVLGEVAKRLGSVAPRVRVYAESYRDYSTVARGSGADTLLDLAGVDNIALSQPVPFPTISPEWVVAQNPRVIVKASSSQWLKMGYNITDLESVVAFRQGIMNRPVWTRIDAVRNNRVFLLSNEIWTGPRAPVGILYIAKWCYPDLFADIDPEVVHRNWLLKWHGKELKGIYAYP